MSQTNNLAPETDPSLQAAPRSAYFHIPFCRHRCGYCNFSLVAGRDHLVDRYLDALELEVTAVKRQFTLDTLFLGGGTPSHLNSSQLKRFQDIISTRFSLAENAEVTAECNPNDVSQSKVDALASIGVNRISLGVQSLNPDKLIKLERDHVLEEVKTAVTIAQQTVGSVSMDLIFAAPQETLEQWQTDLNQAIELEPDHFSTYELTYEKGTQFWNRRERGELLSADEDLRADMYQWTIGRLEEAGWRQYELSSFSKSEHECRHNQIYWTGRSYFAFGSGASAFLDGQRITNHSSTMQYMKLLESGKSPVAFHERLTGIDAAKERLAFGLRRIAGVAKEQFQKETGFSIEEVLSKSKDRLLEHGLIELSGSVCKLTSRGVMVGDGVASEILGPSS